MGAPRGKDPGGKIQAIAKVIHERKWNIVLITDIRFPVDGCHELKVGGFGWLLVTHGRVGVALDPYWAARWRNGGAVLHFTKGQDISNRILGLQIQGKGWKPGMLLVSVYAPISSKTSIQHRDQFREQLSLLLDKTSGRLKPILGGDFNGEVGPTKDSLWKHVLGPYGDTRRTKGGEELLSFCELEHLVVANTFFAQDKKCTWYHNRWGTEHALDHFLVRNEDRRWVRTVKTLHFSSTPAAQEAPTLGRSGKYAAASWLAYTDHNPIEMEWIIGKNWAFEASQKAKQDTRPDVLRLMGTTPEAAALRTMFAEAVTKSLGTVEADFLDWGSVASILRSCALQVLGPVPPRNPLPWLQGKERELKQLSDQVHYIEIQLAAARQKGDSQVSSLLEQRKQASKALSSSKKKWEQNWWDELADTAQKAHEQHDDYTFWQVCKTLGFRESRRLHQVCKRTVPCPEQEREAWKIFLSNIQHGTGEVNPSVWEHVPLASSEAASLRDPPTRQEFSKALAAMKPGKRGGIDEVTVELIKFGGPALQDSVFNIISTMWSDAANAPPGQEAATWHEHVVTGVCIPVFKNKGDRNDRNNYRNLVMLSIAAKLVARIVASRLSVWAEPLLSEEQNGFRQTRGIDDAHQLARRIIEEVVISKHDKTVAITCFDIKRAYTRVCRSALWILLARLGVPIPFLQVLKALHEHTKLQVFIHNGYSSSWLTDRGLREGCPSSPILFNLFHTFIMRTFRARRATLAAQHSLPPGLPWDFKVDGRLTRTGNAKLSSRGVQSVCLGDVEYADDTQIYGFEEEVTLAEQLFEKTLIDWEQQENTDKRERLILCTGGRTATEVLNQFEHKTIKHLGAFLNDSADYWTDTKKRVQAGFFAVRRVARLWSLGTAHGRGSNKGLSNSRKLKIMRSVLEGTLLACGKTRVWSKVQERKAQQVLSRGIRRALGVDRLNMRQHSYSDEGLRRLVQWDSFEDLLHRNVLRWVGHVARMPISRLPKIALFGWPTDMTKHTSARFTFPMWVKWLLSKHGISHLDWFRLAQKPTSRWLQLLNSHLPRAKPSKDQLKNIDHWRPGMSLPAAGCPAPSAAPPPLVDPASDGEEDNPETVWSCPACPFIAETARGLQNHYDNIHTPADRDVTTVYHSSCPLCKVVFVTAREAKRHKCPSLVHHVDNLPALPAPAVTASALTPAQISGWAIYTDGSGPVNNSEWAGWGAAIWSHPVSCPLANYELFGPVPLEQWDPRWLGAEAATNNTAEVTAIAEALLWLEQEAPGPKEAPVSLWFDSTYAQEAITGQTTPKENIALITTAREIWSRVSAIRKFEWCKVKAHSGNHGNDYADKLAAAGATGKQTTHSSRWVLPVGSPTPNDPLLTDWCWRCGQVFSGESYARQLAGHEGYCKVPGAPPANIPCRRNCGVTFQWRFADGKRKQAHHAREFRNKHEKICRGTPQLTRTCPHCETVFPEQTSDDVILLHRQKCSPDNSSLSSMWKCPLCKSRVAKRNQAEHTSRCRGSAQANKTCSKCSEVLQSADACIKHETICRGSKTENLKCSKCKRSFTTFGSRITHEKSCKK